MTVLLSSVVRQRAATSWRYPGQSAQLHTCLHVIGTSSQFTVHTPTSYGTAVGPLDDFRCSLRRRGRLQVARTSAVHSPSTRPPPGRTHTSPRPSPGCVRQCNRRVAAVHATHTASSAQLPLKSLELLMHALSKMELIYETLLPSRMPVTIP